MTPLKNNNVMVPMAKVAAGEIKIGDVAGAKRMAQEAKNPPEQVTILLNIAEAQIELGDFAGAKATAASNRAGCTGFSLRPARSRPGPEGKQGRCAAPGEGMRAVGAQD